MRTFIYFMIVSILLAVAAPAYSASVSHTFKCEQDDDATEQALIALASKFLKAAKGVKGGENMMVSLHFPLAGTNGATDFAFVLTVPTATEWGTFADNFPGSAAEALNGEWDELAACPDSTLIRSVKVE